MALNARIAAAPSWHDPYRHGHTPHTTESRTDDIDKIVIAGFDHKDPATFGCCQKQRLVLSQCHSVHGILHVKPLDNISPPKINDVHRTESPTMPNVRTVGPFADS
jgi:hypothetical protein